MKYIVLGYLDEKRWDAMSKQEQDAWVAACLTYDDVLRQNGHFVAAEALHRAPAAALVRLESGTVSVTDVPLAVSREQLGGIYVLDAKDLNHAIQLISNHPGARLGGCFEIRPAEELSACDRAGNISCDFDSGMSIRGAAIRLNVEGTNVTPNHSGELS
jgi:hypothetical protein